jgi:hypothetical protein
MHVLDQRPRLTGLDFDGKPLTRKLAPQLEQVLYNWEKEAEFPEHEASIVVDLSQCIQGTSIQPTTAGITTATTGTAIDMSMAENLTNAVVIIGAVTGTSPSLTGQLEECATTNGTFTVIAGNTTFSVTTSNQYISLIGNRVLRYARLNMTTTAGTSPVFVTAGIIIEQAKMSDTTAGYSRLPNTL